MLHLLTLALILFASGGVIAWIGDKLGTYVGKKRLSSFGLRPRHTAMLYTIASGGVIAVLTLAIAAAIDSTYLVAIRSGAEIIHTNHELSAQNRLFAQNIKDAESQLLVVEGLVSTAKDAELLARRFEKTAELHLADARKSLRSERETLQVTESKLLTSRADLVSMQSQLQSRQNALEVAKKRVVLEKQQLQSAKVQLAAATLAVRNQGQVLYNLTQQLVAGQHQFDVLSLRNKKLAEEYVKYSTHPVIFKETDEIERTVISSHQSLDDIRTALIDFLSSVRLRASELGAVPGITGNPVEIVDPSEGPQSELPTREAELLRERDHIESIVQQIAGAKSNADSVVVIATALHNAVVGQQLQIRIQLVYNQLIYKKGDAIASTTIDGAQDGLEIFAELTSFFPKVTQEAIRDNIIPHRDPQTRLNSVGKNELGFAKIKALVTQIQKVGGEAVVTARAKTATFTTGPVDLDFVVTPAPAAHPSGAPTKSVST